MKCMGMFLLSFKVPCRILGVDILIFKIKSEKIVYTSNKILRESSAEQVHSFSLKSFKMKKK